MSRLQVLAAEPRLALGALAALLLAAAAVVGSGADFTAASANPSNTFASGTLAAMGTTSLGTFAGGAKHRYKFAVSLDSTADNAYQGDNATAEFDFSAA